MIEFVHVRKCNARMTQCTHKRTSAAQQRSSADARGEMNLEANLHGGDIGRYRYRGCHRCIRHQEDVRERKLVEVGEDGWIVPQQKEKEM